nr:hypothetical protein [Clavibacter michiganensis]
MRLESWAGGAANNEFRADEVPLSFVSALDALEQQLDGREPREAPGLNDGRE